jgi:hypothetical protein
VVREELDRSAFSDRRARGPDWHLYEGELIDFLVAVIEGRERVSVFPEDVPSESPGFERA